MRNAFASRTRAKGELEWCCGALNILHQLLRHFPGHQTTFLQRVEPKQEPVLSRIFVVIQQRLWLLHCQARRALAPRLTDLRFRKNKAPFRLNSLLSVVDQLGWDRNTRPPWVSWIDQSTSATSGDCQGPPVHPPRPVAPKITLPNGPTPLPALPCQGRYRFGASGGVCGLQLACNTRHQPLTALPTAPYSNRSTNLCFGIPPPLGGLCKSSPNVPHCDLEHLPRERAGGARLETLRTESTSSFGLLSHTMSGRGLDQGAQITSLQQMVNQLQAVRDAFAERLQEQERGAEPLGKKPRMREDFVVNTVEKLVKWMHARQQEMIEAVSRGSAHDRVCERVNVGKPRRLRSSRHFAWRWVKLHILGTTHEVASSQACWFTGAAATPRPSAPHSLSLRMKNRWSFWCIIRQRVRQHLD